MNPTSFQGPFVSVIILNYNGKKFVERCLDTVLADPYQPKEILFVDNASTDDSLDLVWKYQDRITIVENEKNFGFPKGCNEGIRIARGDIIVLLNIDTAVRPDWLHGLIQPMIDFPDVGITGSKLLFLDGKSIQFAGGGMQPNGLTYHDGYALPDDGSYNVPRNVEYITGASMAVRREILDRLGGLDEGFPLYFEDIDLCCRARKLGYRVRYQPDSVVYHFETFGTKKQSFTYYYKYHRGRMRFLLKHFGMNYFLFTFLPEEWRWYKQCNLHQQLLPLLFAYATQWIKAPYFWTKGFILRRLPFSYSVPCSSAQTEVQ